MLKPQNLHALLTIGLLCLFWSTFSAGAAYAQSAPSWSEESLFLADEGLLLLDGPFLGPVGSEAVYILTFENYVELYDPDDPFNDGIFEAHQDAGALAVQYTVLEADPATGGVRLRVRAYAIDPDSYETLEGDGWEFVYRMQDDDVVLLSGDAAPEEYEGLLRPDWLVNWSMSRDEDRPRGAVAEGDVWFSVAEHPIPDGGNEVVLVDVVGEFVEWDFVQDIGPIAYVEEFGSGAGPFPGAVPPGWISIGDAEFYQEGTYVFVPGFFPGYVGRWLEVSAAFATGSVPGSSSRVATIGFMAEFDWDPTGYFPWPPTADAARVDYPVLERGLPVQSVLGPNSDLLWDDTYVDTYVFTGATGEDIVLRLDSDDFDAFLFLLDDKEEQLATDDDSGGDLNALIRYTLPYSGTYHVWVNTWAPGDGGTYSLTLDTAKPFASDDYPAVAYGDRIVGALSARSERLDDGSFADGYRFDGEADDVIDAYLVSDGFDAYLILLEDTGEWLQFDDDSGGNLNARLRQKLPYTGTYVLMATSWGSDEVGDYVLELNLVEPVDMSGYAVLEPGVAATGMLGAWSELHDDDTYVDYYRFTGHEGDRIVVSLQSADFDSYLFLIDDTGHVLESDDDSGGGGDALLRFELPYDGEYGVLVNTYFEGERGMYTVRLESLGAFDLQAALDVLALLGNPEQLTRKDMTWIEWSLDDLYELFWDAWPYVAD